MKEARKRQSGGSNDDNLIRPLLTHHFRGGGCAKRSRPAREYCDQTLGRYAGRLRFAQPRPTGSHRHSYTRSFSTIQHDITRMKLLLVITVFATIASATNLRGDEGHRQLPRASWHKCLSNDDCGTDEICCGSYVGGDKCKNQCEWMDIMDMAKFCEIDDYGLCN